MRARMVIPSLLCFWMVFVTVAYCADQSEKEKAAAEAATVWLALVDSGQYRKLVLGRQCLSQCGVEGARDEYDALQASSSWQHGNAAS